MSNNPLPVQPHRTLDPITIIQPIKLQPTEPPKPQNGPPKARFWLLPIIAVVLVASAILVVLLAPVDDEEAPQDHSSEESLDKEVARVNPPINSPSVQSNPDLDEAPSPAPPQKKEEAGHGPSEPPSAKPDLHPVNVSLQAQAEMPTGEQEKGGAPPSDRPAPEPAMRKAAKEKSWVFPAQYGPNSQWPEKPRKRSKMKRLVRTLNHRCPKGIELYGHTTTTGSESLNADIGFGRAKVALTYLKKYGLKVEAKRIESKGSTELIAEGSNPNNRRVTVVCH